MTGPSSTGMLDRPNARAAGLLFFFACVGAWFARPLGWVPIGLVDLPHAINLPFEMLMALVAIPVMISGRLAPPRWFVVPAGIYLTVCAANWIWFNSHPLPALRLASYALVPYGIACALQRNPRNRPRLRRVLALLWLWHLFLGAWNYSFGHHVIGLAGNRNWSAALALSLMPWAWVTFGRKRSQPVRRAMRAAVVLATILFLIPCDSRAAWLALIVVSGLWVAASWPWRQRIIVGIAMLFVVCGFVLLKPLWLMDKVREDVRLPLTARTIAMITHNDLLAAAAARAIGGDVVPIAEAELLRAAGPEGFAGVGAGNFRRAFAPYRATSTYGERRVAAPSTIHPHNEFLLVGAEIGAAAAICWLIMMLTPTLGGLRNRDPQRSVAALAALSLLVCSFFDMPLTTRPTSVVFLLVLGAAWPRLRPAVGMDRGTPLKVRMALTSASLFVGLATAVTLGAKQLRAEHHMRRAYIEENFRKNPAAAFGHYATAGALHYKPEDPLLFAGSISMRKLDNPKRGLEWLLKASEVDPNVGLLNREIGQAHFIQAQYAEAIPYLDRHRRLFPHEPDGWHRFYVGCYFSGDLATAGRLGLEMPRVWLHRLNLLHPSGRLAPAVKTWLEACRTGEPAQAAAVGDAFAEPLGGTAWDPLTFILLEPLKTDPKRLTEIDMTQADFDFWQRQLSLVERFPPPAEITVESLVAMLREGDRDPGEDPVSTIIAFGFQHGLSAYRTTWEGKPGALFIFPDGSGKVVAPEADWGIFAASQDQPAKLDLPLSCYRVRNQIMGQAARATGTPVAAPLPSLELLRLFRWYGKAPPPAQLLDYVEPPVGLKP
jgi:hypothetical protein